MTSAHPRISTAIPAATKPIRAVEPGSITNAASTMAQPESCKNKPPNLKLGDIFAGDLWSIDSIENT
jgi:hypothetical protein